MNYSSYKYYYYYYIALSFLFVRLSYAEPDANGSSLQSILNEIFNTNNSDEGPSHSRRQLDFGSTNPGSWPGRWFPDKPSHHEPSSNVKEESWPGRWFPGPPVVGNVTTSPPPFSSNNDGDSGGEDSNDDSYDYNEMYNTTEGESDQLHQEKVHHRPTYTEIPPKDWTGRWFPSTATEKSIILPENSEASIQDVQYNNSMWNMINSSCDDGKTNLTVDWSGSPINYTCFNPHQYLLPDYDIPSIIIKSLIPLAYQAKHECMSKEIHYDSDLPTFGTHRPAWPRYGEYQFVPRQRWIHSLEHGAIVMLYHPCSHPQLVSELRELVSRCIFRHIITPYTLLPHDRPLALLSWGWALLMPTPDENIVKTFIKEHAKKGPEKISRDGQFSEGLMRPAAIISDPEDTDICPSTVLF